jgi:hypothetical protein
VSSENFRDVGCEILVGRGVDAIVSDILLAPFAASLFLACEFLVRQNKKPA